VLLPITSINLLSMKVDEDSCDGEEGQDAVSLCNQSGHCLEPSLSNVDSTVGSLPLRDINSPFTTTRDNHSGGCSRLKDEEHDGGSKTTHVVIHEETWGTSSGESNGSQPTRLHHPSSDPSQGLCDRGGHRYQWDTSAFESVIPVRCKSSNGELHKAKFGSGLLILY